MIKYKSLSKCIMGLREKVALVYAGLFIIFIAHADCMPKTKKTLEILKKCNARPHNVESIYQKYNFPETEYSTSFMPRTAYDLDNFDRTYSLKEPSKRSQNLLKQTRNKRKRKPINNNRRKIENSIDDTPHLPSVPKCDDIPHFPEVEYPLNARDTWKPIYFDDLFPSVDNGQDNTFKSDSKKISKRKHEFDINKCFKSKPAPDKTKVRNDTNTGICTKDMNNNIMMTPVSNNFIMKDKDSLPVITKAENEVTESYSATRANSSNVCELNIDQPDYKDINKSMIISTTLNCTTLTDFCSDDKNNSLLPGDNKDGERDISIDEEFTTDEPDFAFALSTPPPNTEDMLWRESKIIEPCNSMLYPDELDDYFIQVKN